MLDRNLNDMSRRDLSDLARSLGVADAEVMTRAELRAAIERTRSSPPSTPPPWPTTWLGVARGLIASIVEQGLNLPDAAALIRGDTKLSTPPKPPPPVATVTLARIYAAQGHLQRAIDTLDQVVSTDPDHELARSLRDEFAVRAKSGRGSSQRKAAGEGPLEPASELAASAPPSTPPSAPPSAPSAADAAAPLTSREPALSEYFESAPTLFEAPSTLIEAEPTLIEPLPSAALSAEATVQDMPPSSEPPPTVIEPPLEPAPLESMPHEALAHEAVALEQRVARVVSNGAAPAAPRAALMAVRARPVAELVVLEAEGAPAYVCWEIGHGATNGELVSGRLPRAGDEGHYSLLLVAHSPQGSGCVREERRLPLSTRAGLLRLSGLPERSVLRGLLTQDRAAVAKTLAVAGCVRLPGPGEAELKVIFSAYAVPNPADLAMRAIERLADASVMHW